MSRQRARIEQSTAQSKMLSAYESGRLVAVRSRTLGRRPSRHCRSATEDLANEREQKRFASGRAPPGLALPAVSRALETR